MAHEAKAKGTAALEAGKFERAIIHFSKAISFSPGNHVLYSDRSASYASLHKYQKALEDANKTLELKPDWAKGYGRLGAALLGLGKHDDAVGAFKKGLEYDPANEGLQSGLSDAQAAKSRARLFTSSMADEMKAKGIAALSTGKFKEAIKHFSDAISLNPSNHVLYSNRSASYASLRRYEKALEDAKKTLELKPGWVKGYNRVGAAFIGLGKHDDAIEAFKKGLEYDPANEGLQSGLSDAQAAKSRTRSLASNMADEAMAKGNAALSDGKFEEAIKHFSDAISLVPSNHVLYTNRSASYASLHNYQEALEDAQKSVELKSDWVKGYNRLGAAFIGLGKHDNAVGAYKRGLQYDPANEGLQSGLSYAQAAKSRARADEAKAKGNAALSDGKFEEAIKHFSDAISLSPSNHVLYSKRSASYASLHQYQEALEDAKKTVELKPDWVKGYSRLGAAFIGLGKHEDAVGACKKGLEYDPANEGLQSGISDAQAAKSITEKKTQKAAALKERGAGNAACMKMDFDTAVQHYTKAIELDDEDILTLTSRAAAYFEMGKIQSKEELLYQEVQNGNHDAVKALRLSGASLEWVDRKGRTPLILACTTWGELLGMPSTLLNLGANVNVYRPGTHRGTPLHHAAKRGLEKTVTLLLSWGANPMVINDTGLTPLQMARSWGHVSVVRILEEHLCLFSGMPQEISGQSGPSNQPTSLVQPSAPPLQEGSFDYPSLNTGASLARGTDANMATDCTGQSGPSNQPTSLVQLSAPPLQEGSFDYPSLNTGASLAHGTDAYMATDDKLGGTCVICWDAPAEGVCVPCGHLAGCMDCWAEVKAHNMNCPVCRVQIQQVIKVYAV